MSKPIDLKGKKFGKLLVLKLSHKKTIRGSSIWVCKCDCGNIKEIRGGNLTKKWATKSCGCLWNGSFKEFLKERSKWNGECLEWTKGGYQYGHFTRKGKNYLAHRVAYEVAYGKIPKGMLVCHTCDNRRCINPKHLFLGTIQDNSNDMKLKGRQCRGEKSHTSKLSESEVIRIRNLHSTYGVISRKLAKEYGVTSSTINKIVNRKTWKHLF